MEPSERVVESVLLTEDEYDNLVAAREAMYGDRASEVDLSHVISLLSLAEVRRCEEREIEEQRLFDGMDETDLPDKHHELP